jgi:hypothetical protein
MLLKVSYGLISCYHVAAFKEAGFNAVKEYPDVFENIRKVHLNLMLNQDIPYLI